MKKLLKGLYAISIVLCCLLAIALLTVTVLKKSLVIYGIVVGLVIIATIISLYIYQKNIHYVQSMEYRLSLWNTISYQVKGAGQDAFSNLPIGIIIYDKNYNVVWGNKVASKCLQAKLDDAISLKVLCNGSIYDFVRNNIDKKEYAQILPLYDKLYEIRISSAHNAVYLTDMTDLVSLRTRYEEKVLSLGFLSIDNFDEILREQDINEKSETVSTILNVINEWCSKNEFYLRQLSESKYLLISTYKSLQRAMENEFEVLDDVKKSLSSTKGALITLSIGFASDDCDVNTLSQIAEDQLALAINRGGDQVCVSVEGKTQFFGARQESKKHINRANLRYKANELIELIKKSDKVYCLGHRYQDADSFASCLSLFKLCNLLDKECYVIFDKSNIDATVSKVYDDVNKMSISVMNALVDIKDAVKNMTDNTLLIVSDCQAENNLYIGVEQLYKFKNIAIIDHHRKNEAGTIINTVFNYTDPTASSTVEIIISLLESVDYKLELTPMEATWLMLGIVVDTSNFVYRTTSQTFEIASILNSYQLNMGLVQEYLKEDLKEKQIRNTLVHEMTIYKNSFAITSLDDNKTYLKVATISKVSDELLTIEGLEFAATMAYVSENTVRISSRSLGRVNCQLIMERLGGGGHLTGAACEIKNKTIEEIIILLKASIDQELDSKIKSTKVILTGPYKALGERGDIIELTVEEAESLLNTKYGVLATHNNIREFELEKQSLLAFEEKKAKEFNQLIEKIKNDNYSFSYNIEKLNNNKITSILAKRIKTLTGINVNRQNISLLSNVNSYGIYKAMIKLDKKYYAEMTFKITKK